MKLQEAKEQIAEKEGFNNWEEFSEFTNYANDYEIAFNEAAEIYAEQKAKDYGEYLIQNLNTENVAQDDAYLFSEKYYEQFKNSTL